MISPRIDAVLDITRLVQTATTAEEQVALLREEMHRIEVRRDVVRRALEIAREELVMVNASSHRASIAIRMPDIRPGPDGFVVVQEPGE